MNLYQIRIEFDRIMRSLGDGTFDDWRDDWINLAWLKLSTMFVVPALERSVTIDSVADQQVYLLPYDFNDAEVRLWFKESATNNYKRLDPVPEEILGLAYERRSSNMGPVEYYGVTHNVGSDYASRTCTLTNNSATVACAAADAGDAGYWIRFDPFTSGSDTVDPGDYGYRITSVDAGVSYTIDRAYRGPAGSATGRLRPAEQGQFITYGIPSAAVTDAFSLKYYGKPRRLFNDADVPEWPNASISIAYMAVSVAMDYLMHYDGAKVWFGRAASHIGNLQKRKEYRNVLISDLTVGSISGRKTGMRPVMLGRAMGRSTWR